MTYEEAKKNILDMCCWCNDDAECIYHEEKRTDLCEKCEFYFAIEALEKQSKIIHCKDCENWILIPNSHNIGCCKFAMWLIGENGFCLYGKVEE